MNENQNKKPNTDLPKFLAGQLADLIKQADTKAAATFSVLGVTAAALLSRLTVSRVEMVMENPVAMILLLVATIIILVALKTSIAVIYPRTATGKKGGMTYFRDILQSTEAEYVRQGKNITEEETVELLYKHVYNLSQIANKKFAALKQAMILSAVAIILTIGTLFAIFTN